MSSTINDAVKATKNAMAFSVLAPGAALPPWICIVERDQVWRDNKSGGFFEVASVRVIATDAQVTLRMVDAQSGDEHVSARASVLCAGTAWSRLADNEGATSVWVVPVKPSRVGLALRSARASS